MDDVDDVEVNREDVVTVVSREESGDEENLENDTFLVNINTVCKVDLRSVEDILVFESNVVIAFVVCVEVLFVVVEVRQELKPVLPGQAVLQVSKDVSSVELNPQSDIH